MPAHISDRSEFNAPAEVVFGVLTDPDRITRWLPRGMRTESVKDQRVRVEAGSRLHEFTVDTDAEELRVRWRSLDVSGLQAVARVQDAPAGGSVLEAEVEAPDGLVDESRLRDLLAETMTHLGRDVSDNFNAG
ncbi:SRPBCC family protein [Actinoplanes sp. URMC 104]|uniref:SRPBCC family protein n=1 Tax=Actinoplanes sp. URMC 104 TaxID=3423409 RepID=UPI003F1A9058